MNTIKTVSFYLAYILKFLIFFIPFFIIFQWIFFSSDFIFFHEADVIRVHHNIIDLHVISWTSISRLLACCAQLIGTFPFVVILYFFAQICHRYANGQFFIIHNVKAYYRIGQLLFFDALFAQPISDALWVCAATISNPVGQRYIRIQIGTPNIIAVLMGLLVIFISWVMLEATKMQEEQCLTI